MNKTTWQPYIERLKQHPEDAEALAALESALAAASSKPSAREQVVRAGKLGRFGSKMFLGKPLTRAIADGWDAWSAYFQGHYTPRSHVAWPEHETRDISAAIANRFLRIGAFGVLIGLIPAIILAFQTALMLIQVWQVNVQNDIVREQNTLTRQQFAVGYATQLRHQIYAGECTDRTDASTCTPSELPAVRAEAAQSLVRLADIASQGARGEDQEEQVSATTTRASLRGALLEQADLTGVDFDAVDLDGANLKGAKLTRAKLSDASLQGADLSKATIHDSTFAGAHLERAKLDRARVQGATFTGSDLRSVSLDGAVLQGISFEGARFYPQDEPVLRDRGQTVDFSRAEALTDLSFKGANLIKANFSKKSWLRLDFEGAELMQSTFAGASLTKSSFKGANLDGANLDGATLIDVDLSGASFKGAKTSNLTLKHVTCPDGEEAKSRCKF